MSHRPECECEECLREAEHQDFILEGRVEEQRLQELQGLHRRIKELEQALLKAQWAMHWHKWNDPKVYTDRDSLEAKASDAVDVAVQPLAPLMPQTPASR